jgi:ubiquinone/menaquinone biosynthesis C-methylase UbiE
MIDQDLLTEVSKFLLDRDMRVLQGFRLAATDREHIAKLLDYMDPGPDTIWADIGCGFGEPARIMQELRPDLRFHLVNNNQFQAGEAAQHFPTWLADMHELPFDTEDMDGVMFLFSLCQADDPSRAIIEAARVTKPGGKLFVFDYMRNNGDDYISWKYLHARFFGMNAMNNMCRLAGWRFGGCVAPEGSNETFRVMFEDQILYHRIFNDLTPVVWWAVRQ